MRIPKQVILSALQKIECIITFCLALVRAAVQRTVESLTDMSRNRQMNGTKLF